MNWIHRIDGFALSAPWLQQTFGHGWFPQVCLEKASSKHGCKQPKHLPRASSSYKFTSKILDLLIPADGSFTSSLIIIGSHKVMKRR